MFDFYSLVKFRRIILRPTFNIISLSIRSVHIGPRHTYSCLTDYRNTRLQKKKPFHRCSRISLFHESDQLLLRTSKYVSFSFDENRLERNYFIYINIYLLFHDAT